MGGADGRCHGNGIHTRLEAEARLWQIVRLVPSADIDRDQTSARRERLTAG